MKGSGVMEDKKPMNILIVGNGFDIAHGLPTRYGDFFDFLKLSSDIITDNTKELNEQGKPMREAIKTLIIASNNLSTDVLGRFLCDDIDGCINKILYEKNIIKKNRIYDKEGRFDYDKCKMQLLLYFNNISKNNIWCKIIDKEATERDNANLRHKVGVIENRCDAIAGSFNKKINKNCKNNIITRLNTIKKMLSKGKKINENNEIVHEIEKIISEATGKITGTTRMIYGANELIFEVSQIIPELRGIKKESKEIDKYNWIDIESIIKETIKALDDDDKNEKWNEFFDKLDINKYNLGPLKKSNKEKRIQVLNQNLYKFTLAFEIYIYWITNCFLFKYKRNKRFRTEFIDKITNVISFNYTNTYRIIYNDKFSAENIDFIHGEAGNNNIIIGIGEYLDDEKKDKQLDFVRFKKYFQRIYKKTGCKYQKWLKNVTENSPINVYIIGHSLDETDKDILKGIITHPGVKTTIFYHDKKSHDREIINMIKIIGQDKLTEMVYGSDPKIIFSNQEEIMVK